MIKINEKCVKASKYDPTDDWSGFDLRYTYPGDSLSDYETNIIVRASNVQDAINKAKKYFRVKGIDAYNIRKDRNIDSIKAFLKKYPHCNFDILESI